MNSEACAGEDNQDGPESIMIPVNSLQTDGRRGSFTLRLLGSHGAQYSLFLDELERISIPHWTEAVIQSITLQSYPLRNSQPPLNTPKPRSSATVQI